MLQIAFTNPTLKNTLILIVSLPVQVAARRAGETGPNRLVLFSQVDRICWFTLVDKRFGVRDEKTTVAELIQLVEEFVAQRDWQKFHDPKNLSASIAIEAAELMEHFQWLRSEEAATVVNDPVASAEIREEVADILAYLLSFAARMKIDLSTALRDKMQKNAAKYPVDQFRGKFKQS